MYAYRMEVVAEVGIADLLATLGGDGWRLVVAFPHPYETENAEPKFITFWEKSLPTE